MERGHLSDKWTFATPFIQIKYGGSDLGSGSAFFWRYGDQTFLVTNWHNLSGRNHLTGIPIHSQAALPDRVHAWVFKREVPRNDTGLEMLRYRPIEIILCENDHTDPVWFEHPVSGQKVDIGVINVTKAVQGFEIKHANEVEDDAVLSLSTAQEVFIIGFPFGQIAGAWAPIWKRGIIALEPTLNPEGSPKLLIDTATRPGMSGSVVVARHIVVGRGVKRKDGSDSEPFLYAEMNTVVGIYSGRHYPDFEKAQLGVAWKREVIEATVSGTKRASV